MRTFSIGYLKEWIFANCYRLEFPFLFDKYSDPLLVYQGYHWLCFFVFPLSVSSLSCNLSVSGVSSTQAWITWWGDTTYFTTLHLTHGDIYIFLYSVPGYFEVIFESSITQLSAHRHNCQSVPWRQLYRHALSGKYRI